MKTLGMLFPREAADAQKRNVPLVMAGGTVEYHGAHCAFGCDTLIAEGLIEKLAEEREIVAAPSVWYSPSSYAVAGRDSGTVHVRKALSKTTSFTSFTVCCRRAGATSSSSFTISTRKRASCP